MSQRARFVLITLVILASASLPAVASAQPIHEPGFPQAARVSCGADLPESEVVETDSAIRSGLVYIPFSKQYIYVWKTRPEMASARWQLTLRFTDGTEASALQDAEIDRPAPGSDHGCSPVSRGSMAAHLHETSAARSCARLVPHVMGGDAVARYLTVAEQTTPALVGRTHDGPVPCGTGPLRLWVDDR